MTRYSEVPLSQEDKLGPRLSKRAGCLHLGPLWSAVTPSEVPGRTQSRSPECLGLRLPGVASGSQPPARVYSTPALNFLTACLCTAQRPWRRNLQPKYLWAEGLALEYGAPETGKILVFEKACLFLSEQRLKRSFGIKSIFCLFKERRPCKSFT